MGSAGQGCIIGEDLGDFKGMENFCEALFPA